MHPQPATGTDCATLRRRPAGLRRPPLPPPGPTSRPPRHAPTRCIPPPAQPAPAPRRPPARDRDPAAPARLMCRFRRERRGRASPSPVRLCLAFFGAKQRRDLTESVTFGGCVAGTHSDYPLFFQSRGGVGKGLIVMAPPGNPAATRASPQTIN